MGVTEWLSKCSAYNVLGVFVYVNSTTPLVTCDNSESKWAKVD